MDLRDNAVTIHPYYKVSNENLASFKKLAQDLVETTRGEMGCLYYGFSYGEGEAFCREGYKDAESLVAHLDNVADLLERITSIAEIFRLEIHGPEEEVVKLREWISLKELNPKYYVLEPGFRN
ncbi:hypothetical protein [Prochlorococcus sp. MIT 1307]|uniref:putative quinol monooxygenase n=1 Tax=Prochlorococcus sp. MIT 1307 TaxID=3096219 RepID=UPI002A761177|nr:hypothetical protein [Prochlorococcus sp. MIT 1307]